jgi:hypothetical protein
MTANIVVRDYQRALGRLVNDYERARARAKATATQRDLTIAAQDEKVARAQQEVGRTIANMAAEVGAELTANVLKLDVKDVRRLTRALTVRGEKEPTQGINSAAPASGP